MAQIRKKPNGEIDWEMMYMHELKTHHTVYWVDHIRACEFYQKKAERYVIEMSDLLKQRQRDSDAALEDMARKYFEVLKELKKRKFTIQSKPVERDYG